MIAAAAPQGVVTFLFTDIEGSTRRWEADAEAMRTALETHDALLRRVIEEHHGWLFKHTGDGVCVAFSSPRSAVDAAIAAQRVLDLPVRIGIATGEAELRGSDYFGAVLNRAARIMAAGHGGQILIDGLTARLLSGVDLLDLGSKRLRDLTQPVEMFQVRAPNLRADFPPLTTLDPTPGNLRSASTSLVGRESELVEVRAELRTNRLLTLTGVGGVGKTRLALEVAARSAVDFPDGVWVVELAAVTDPAAVPDAVAAVLGIRQQPGMRLADGVAAALEGRSLLLVLDNCEHVLDAAADLIESILTRSITVRILATSREGLGVDHEQLWPVPSLDTDIGLDSAAATLFVERARVVAPGISFSVADESIAVVEICRRLDGIPLGIELAASRMVSMTAVDVRDRLDDRFRLLTGSRRGLGRHQTLWHAVQWSYDLLVDAEKALLTSCSVFAGGFEPAAACAVAGFDDEFVTLDLIDALVRKSLLVADRSSGRARFSMLETIRQFAEEQLVADGGAEEARQAHARHFAGREAAVMARWDGPRQREAYTWYSVELPNLRAAFRWAADNADLKAAVAIATYATFLGILVEQHEALGWAEEILEPAKAVDHPRLAQLSVMAAQCYDVGRLDDFVGYATAAEMAIDSGCFDEIPEYFESSIPGGYLLTGQPGRCIELCDKLIARKPGPHGYLRALRVVALTIVGAADAAMAASEGFLAEVDTITRQNGPGLACFTLYAYGYAHRDTNPGAAYDALLRGLTIAHDSGNRQLESGLIVMLSRQAAARDDPTDAFEFVALAIRRYYDSGSFPHLSGPLTILAKLFDRLGHYEPAATISEFADSPLTRAAYPEITTTIAHLRDVLGDEAYESFARAGAGMTNAAMVAYAFDQIDRVRSELSQ